MRQLLLFRTTRAVIKAERLLRRNTMYCKTIPVPRTISSECGMALEIKAEELESCVALLTDDEISCSPVTVE